MICSDVVSFGCCLGRVSMCCVDCSSEVIGVIELLSLCLMMCSVCLRIEIFWWEILRVMWWMVMSVWFLLFRVKWFLVRW